MDHRGTKRTKRRLRVLYGEDQPTTSSLSVDVSDTGIFVSADRMLPIGTRIHLHLEGQGGRVYLEGEVVRHQLVPAALRQVMAQGMGVRFLRAEECVGIVFGANRGARAPNPATANRAEAQKAVADGGGPVMLCPTPSALDDFIEQQLKRGIAAVPGGSDGAKAGATIDFAVRLAFDGGNEVLASGDVVQVLSTGDGGSTIVVRIKDPKTLIEKLRPMVRRS